MTPTIDALEAKGPGYWRSVAAHGMAVGLPTEQDMGNSEVRATTCDLNLGRVRSDPRNQSWRRAVPGCL